MEVTVRNGVLRGEIIAPPSKSDAHRAIICAALADSPTSIGLSGSNEDIDVTLGCMAALGADIQRGGGEVLVSPIKERQKSPLLDCGESGSTLRFLLPVAAAVADYASFTGRGRLPERPIDVLLGEMEKNGCTASANRIPLTLGGNLKSGEFKIPGNISSQFVSGLLIALPLLDGNSRISVDGALESRAYVEMTVNTLARFGVEIMADEGGYTVRGGQVFCSPGRYQVEGDWSGASAFLVADAIGGSVTVGGLSERSAQPDRAVMGFLDEMPDEVDVSEFPDLFPVLAIRACAKKGDTLLCGAARLRIKESDRISETARLIGDLGGCAEERSDSLLIHGSGRLSGGVTHSANDHRIAMAAGIAAGISENFVTVRDAQAVSKSYPDFWDEIKRLGE